MKLPLLVFLAVLPASAQTVVLLTTAGASTWTAPAGVSSVKVECWGGGGAGGTRTSSGGGGGGGGGAYAARLTMAVTPGVIYSYTVGAAGATNGGGNGGATTFTGDSSVQCVAAGGVTVANGATAGGAGGTTGASTGDSSHVFAGGAGAAASGTSFGGGGGASGGSAATGTSATTAAGATAVTGGGPGGTGKTSPQGNGSAPANGPGGGGGGGLWTSSGTRLGGAGWAGQIKITFNTLTSAVSDSMPVGEVNSGVVTNNHAKTASAVENIQYVEAGQSRWGMGISTAVPVVDLAGQRYRIFVTDALVFRDTWAGQRPGTNFGANYQEHIQYVSADQSRWGISPVTPLAIAESSSKTVQAFFHNYASVVEQIPYMPALGMQWGVEPSSDELSTSETTDGAYTPNTGGTVVTIPRRPVVVR